MERKSTRASMFLLANFLVAILVIYCFSTGCSTGTGGSSDDIIHTNTTTPAPTTDPVIVELIDKDGNPISNAIIKTYTYNDFISFDESMNYNESTTDGNGKVMLEIKNQEKSIVMAFYQESKNTGRGIGANIYSPYFNPYIKVYPAPVVWGNVSDGNNQPVRNSKLNFTPHPTHTDTPSNIEVDTNIHGVYVNPLEPNNYDYSVITNGGPTYSGNLAVESTPNPQRRDIYPQPGPTATIIVGSVEGDVINPEHEPVEGAYVSLYDENNTSTHNTATDRFGKYNLPSINPGNYNLSVLRSGYSRYFAPVSVQNGQTTTANVQLQYYSPSPSPTYSPYPSPYPSPSPTYMWRAENSNTTGNLRTIIYNPDTNNYHAYGDNGIYVRRSSESPFPWVRHTATPNPTDWNSANSGGPKGYILSGGTANQGVISKTEDGNTYTPIPMPTSFPSPIATISVIQDTYWDQGTSTLTAVGTSTGGYQVAAKYNSTNQTWSPIFTSNSYPGSFSTVYFNGVYGVIAGYAYSSGSYYPDIRYNDGGSAWNHSSICADGKINSICYSGSAWYVAGTGNNGYGFLYTTSSLSSSWQQQTVATNPPPFNGVYFTNTQTGFIAADNGKIFQTINGGSTWTVQNLSPSTSANINCVYFPSSTTGWAVGNNGTIYRYDSQ